MENLNKKSNLKKWITGLSSVLVLALVFTVLNSTSIGDYFKASLPDAGVPTCSITATPDMGIAPLNISKFTVTTTGNPQHYGIHFGIGDINDVENLFIGDGDLGKINGGVYTAPNGVYTYPDKGTYTVTLAVWTDEDKPGVCTETIRVLGTNSPTCTIKASPELGNAPLTVNTFTVTTTGNPQHYGVHFGEGQIENPENLFIGDGDLGKINGGIYTDPAGIYTYSKAGTYTVTLAVWTDEDNPGACTETIRVVEPTSGDNCLISLNSNSQYTGEAPLEVQFDASSPYDDSYIENLQIYVNSTDTLPTYTSHSGTSQYQQTHTYTEPGTYVAVLHVNHDGGTDICQSDPITVLAPNEENDPVTFDNAVYSGTKEDYLKPEAEEVQQNEVLPAPATVVLESRISDSERDSVSLTQFVIMVNEWVEDANDIPLESICDTSKPITGTCYLMALDGETFDNPIPTRTPHTFFQELTLGAENSTYYFTVFTRETINELSPNSKDVEYRWANTHNKDEAIEIKTGEGGNTPPTCSISVSPDKGDVPLTVTDFDIETTAGDADDEIVGFTLNMGDNSTIYEGVGDPEDRPQGSYTYDHSATFIVKLDIENSDGQHGECKDSVVVSLNQNPDNDVVEIEPKVLLANGSEYNGSQNLGSPATVTLQATMTDAENDPVDWTQFIIAVDEWIDDPNDPTQISEDDVCDIDNNGNIVVNETCYFLPDPNETLTDPRPHNTPYTYSRVVKLNQELSDYYFTVYTREKVATDSYRWANTHTPAEAKLVHVGAEEISQDNARPNISVTLTNADGTPYDGSDLELPDANVVMTLRITDQEGNKVDNTQVLISKNVIPEDPNDPEQLPLDAICDKTGSNVTANSTCYFFVDTSDNLETLQAEANVNNPANDHSVPYTSTFNLDFTTKGTYYISIFTRELFNPAIRDGVWERWTTNHDPENPANMAAVNVGLVSYFDRPVVIRSSLYQPYPVDFDGFYDGDEQRPTRTPAIQKGTVLGFRTVLNDTDTGGNPVDPVNNVKYVISNRTGNVPPPCDVVGDTVIVEGNCYYTEGSALADTPVSFINYLKFNQEGVYYFDIYADEHVTLENGNEYDVRERTNTDSEESIKITVKNGEVEPPVVVTGDVTLNLTIPLQDRDNDPSTDRGTHATTVWLRLDSLTQDVAKTVIRSFQTDANGHASVNLEDVVLGQSTVTVKTDQHLAQELPVNLVAGANTVTFTYLFGGDIAGNRNPVAQGTFDDLVNSVDIGELYLYWGTKLGQSEYSRIPDLDANTEVGAEDFSTLISNAGKNGEW